MEPRSLKQAEAKRYLDRLSPTRICQLLGPHMTDDRAARIDEVLSRRLLRLTVVVENLHDPHNGAAAIRSAEGVGLQNFHAVEANEPFAVAKGISLQCEQWMDLHLHSTTEACYTALRADGFQIWAAAPNSGTSLEELPTEKSVALVFGNERDGLTAEAQETADGVFSIPMHGFTGNFNLSVSAALSVYVQAERMRRALGAPGDLPADRVEGLRALWYCLSVRAGRLILDQELKVASGPEPWQG
jgi:tRNA (guanosine-2'-O-)-methyltransferase